MAELFADAAGKRWMLRSDGFAFRSYGMYPREALAKARHPWAIFRSPFRADVRWNGVTKGSFIEARVIGDIHDA